MSKPAVLCRFWHWPSGCFDCKTKGLDGLIGNQRDPSLVNITRNDGAVNITGSLSKGLLATGVILFSAFTLVTHAASQTWIQLSPTEGPPDARTLHTSVYRISSNRMLIFGGAHRLEVGEKLLNDLWVLEDADGTTGTPSWTQISTESGPSARSSHTAVYDTNTNSMIVFGGSVGVGSTGSPVLTNEVWVLENADATGDDNPPKWTKLSPADGPSGRAAHTAVYDPSNNRMIVFGGNVGVGSTGSALLTNEVWVLENANGTDENNPPKWTKLTPENGPSERAAHTAVYDPNTNRMVVFGGNARVGTDDSTTLTREVWVLENANGTEENNPPRWTRLSPSGDPGARELHTASYDSNTNRMTVFGGKREIGPTDSSTLSNDVWILVNANGLTSDGQSVIPAWTELSTTDGPPSARNSHTAVYNNTPASNRMIVFAGQTGCADSCVDLNDVWALTDANGIIPPGEPVFGATSTDDENLTAVDTSSVNVIDAAPTEVTETNGIGGGGGDGGTVVREKLTSPVITILGPNPAAVKVGTTYTDKGATASDSLGGDLTAQIVVTSDVNTRVVGRYSVVFKVTDSNGNTATARRTVTVVGTALPGTTITSAVDGRGTSLTNRGSTASKSITFTFAGTDKIGVTGFECSLDSSAFSPCTSPKKFTKLALGSRVFQARTIDKLGRRDPSPARWTWTILTPGELSPLMEDFVLLGTFIAGSERHAIIEGKGGELRRLGLGDTMNGFELAEIHRQRAVFKSDTDTLELVLDFTRR